MSRVRVRDKKSRRHLEMSGDAPVLRIPWSFDAVDGSAVVEGGIARYRDKAGEQVARTRAARLDEVNPGENVLVQYEDAARDPRVWHVAEVEAVDGEEVGS